MVFSRVLQRFVEQRPVCVLARVVLENQFSAARLDEIFEQNARQQYTKELCFSTCAELLCQVALCGQSSVHAAFKKARQEIPVSIVAVYDKLKHVEPSVCEALVQETARPVDEVLRHLKATRREPIAGYRLRIVDGNVLAGTEHRLKVLRGSGAAALPGLTLAVYDHATGLISGLVACEDGHANERPLMNPLLSRFAVDDLVLCDRNFATVDFLTGLASRQVRFLIRQHGGMKLTVIGLKRRAGRCCTGVVFQYDVRLNCGLTCRAIEIVRDRPLKSGGRRVTLLTNVPRSKASAKKLAELYLQRWRIEEAFRQLTQYLSCEVRTLGYPKAALLAFSLAVLAYNCLACVHGALASVHGREKVDEELSAFYVAMEVKQSFDGMTVAVPASTWTVFGVMRPAALAQVLRQLARHVDWKRYTKTTRGPKKPQRRTKVRRGSHVATVRLLETANRNQQ